LVGNYIPFHLHTDYSLLDSCSKPEEYVERAKECDMKALSFSEHGKPLNWTEKWGMCKEAGIRYIHSVEIYMTESLEEKVRDNFHTVLIAKNMDGVKELNKLVTLSCNEEHFYYTNRITFDEFLNLSDNIITTSACLGSPLNKLEESHPRYMELAKKYDFLEIQAHNHPDQIAYNKRLYELSQRLGKPLIAGTDTHSSSKYKDDCRSVLMSAKGKSYGDEDLFDLSFKTYDELVEMFEEQDALPSEVYLEAIENTNKLYDLTEDLELDLSIKYPILYGSREEDSRKFKEAVWRGLDDKLHVGVIPASQEEAFRAAINEEMRVFEKLEMEGFMLSMSEIIRWCQSQGMTIGTARGSVGGSRIAYVTDIIDLNPETWGTVFSRFANEDRKEIGDIDIDCVEEERPKIFQYIIDRFGTDYTARVASFGTIQARGVIDDVGRHLAFSWSKEHEDAPNSENPWSLDNIKRIKDEFDADEKATREAYPELFYYFDGLFGTKISQSVHPAGMVISPINLPEHFGTFDKDGDICLMLDMDNVHEYTGIAKYDFLVLKTLQVIRDACNFAGVKYPKTHEVNWEDEKVWESISNDGTAIFQMESGFAQQSMKRFQPRNIKEMSLVTAAIRPSGTSYRDQLLERRLHKNPSDMLDELLKDNYGFLVYQEDTIKFLMEVCGLSGSEADNVRRAIGRKQRDRLDKAMPDILNGYCESSELPRDEAEAEAKEFLQIIEDSADYQFGYNHSVAYCLLGYMCGYLRYYYPIEFITAFLNNAANEDDINNGTEYAKKMGIKVTMPKWGVSKSDYFFDKDEQIIAKGLSSIKYMSVGAAEEMYELAHKNHYTYFTELLYDLDEFTSLDSRQRDILIKIDFFSKFGNQRELLYVENMFYKNFRRGKAKKIKKEKIVGTKLQPVIERYAVGTTKDGGVAKSYTLLDVRTMLIEIEKVIKAENMPDVNDIAKIKSFKEATGYMGYVSGKEEDRPKLYIMKKYPLLRKRDKQQFGYSLITKSIGSGKESRFTVFNNVYEKAPVEEDDIIYCKHFTIDNGYYTLRDYVKVK
jgi:DNA polymerase-3 subunit alpha